MRLHKNSLKLAGLYLSIIMFITIFFSLSVFQQSLRELERGILSPDIIARDNTPGEKLGTLLPQERQALRQTANIKLDEAKSSVRNRLIVTNLVILLGAGFLSYYLAVRTLRPIEEANESQSRFTADASHELRTPITAMQSEIEVALMNPDLTSEEAKKILESNLEELSKLTALTAGLLKLAQSKYGTSITTKTNVSKLLVQAINQVKLSASDKKIEIKQNIAKDLEVYGDESGLTEALAIVLDNAIKYSPKKSIINANAFLDGKKVTIEIIDRGMGIDKKDQKYIFDRFYRADTARSKTNNQQGYGIGLSIAKRIVEAHKGSIGVKSQPDKGSTFSIFLPANF